MVATWDWMDGREQDVADGVIAWTSQGHTVGLFTSSMGIPDKSAALHITDWTGELSHATYSRKNLTSRTTEELALGYQLKSAPAVWSTLATAAGLARYAPIFRDSDGLVLGYFTLRNAADATDLAAGGSPAILNIGVTIEGPGPGTGSGVATDMASVMGVGMASPTPTKVANFATNTSSTVVALHVFGHNGLATDMAGWVTTVRGMIDQTTGVLGGVTNVALEVTSPPLRKPTKTPGTGETQAQANIREGATFANANGGAFDTYYQGLGTAYHTKGFDTPLANGRKNGIQMGQEWNLTAFPWFMGNDPTGAANMVLRMIDKMEEGTAGDGSNGLDLSGVELIVNFNTLGQASRTAISTFVNLIKAKITAITIDWYDVDAGDFYEDHLTDMASWVDDVFIQRSGSTTATSSNSRVTGQWLLELALANGLKSGVDEWGIVTTEIPPSNLDNQGSGAVNGAVFCTLFADWLEQKAIPSGIFLWAMYFNYDVVSTGLYHMITSGAKYDASVARAIVQARFS